MRMMMKMVNGRWRWRLATTLHLLHDSSNLLPHLVQPLELCYCAASAAAAVFGYYSYALWAVGRQLMPKCIRGHYCQRAGILERERKGKKGAELDGCSVRWPRNEIIKHVIYWER